MPITTPCVVSLTWKLQDTLGVVIDELKEPVEFFYGGDDLLPKVEEALAGQDVGFEASLHLEPEHAFGEYDAALVFFEQRSIFDETIAVGQQYDGPPPGATTPDLAAEAIYTVTEVYPDHVVLDGNHPLAGIALRLQLQVRDVREATEPETEAGSVGEPIFPRRAVGAALGRAALTLQGVAGATSPSGVVTGPVPLKRSSAR